jgi:hypothetical protein
MIALAMATISASSSLSALANCAGRTSSVAPQREQRHAGAARLHQHHPLASPEREAPHSYDTTFDHCRADHAQGLDRDRAGTTPVPTAKVYIDIAAILPPQRISFAPPLLFIGSNACHA